MPASQQTKQRALDAIRRRGAPVCAHEIAREIGATPKAVSQALYRALDDGIDLRRHREPRARARPMVFWRIAQ